MRILKAPPLSTKLNHYPLLLTVLSRSLIKYLLDPKTACSNYEKQSTVYGFFLQYSMQTNNISHKILLQIYLFLRRLTLKIFNNKSFPIRFKLVIQ